jgi:hypothetical protein
MRRAYWELRISARHANPIVCGHKFCATCGRWRLLCDFAREGDMPRGTCAACKRIAARSSQRPRRERKRVLLDPAPLLALLDRVPKSQLSALSRRSGVPPRAIYRYRSGESKRVELDHADRLILALGSHLSLIYDDALAEPRGRRT